LVYIKLHYVNSFQFFPEPPIFPIFPTFPASSQPFNNSVIYIYIYIYSSLLFSKKKINIDIDRRGEVRSGKMGRLGTFFTKVFYGREKWVFRLKK